MNNGHINLISFGHFGDGLIDAIGESVIKEFNKPVKTQESHIDLSIFYNPARKQYDANRLLIEIDSSYASGAFKTIGLFRVDLFIPILTYIYGQAYLNGRTALASLFRLNNERYGMPMDDALLTERFAKEVNHELGHTFGLKHCHIPGCVMNSSTYVEDIDLKSASLCTKCKNEMNIG